jgi:hypothetical protein
VHGTNYGVFRTSINVHCNSLLTSGSTDAYADLSTLMPGVAGGRLWQTVGQAAGLHSGIRAPSWRNYV